MQTARLLEEEGVVELGEDDRAQLSVLDALTGHPKAGDVLMFAIPVCAPYDALNGYKYRIKVTPGPLKKGKASKQALELFLRSQPGHSSGTAAREKELLRAIPEAEMIAAMIGNARLDMPGMTALKKAMKKGKKGDV